MKRIPLYIMFAEMGFKKGAEIGVQRGINAINMFEYIPDLELLMIDPWKGREERHYRRVWRRMKQYGDRARIIRKYSEDVAPLIANGSLDFVHIDGNHEYDYVTLDIILWTRKVRIGGIVSGHDYVRTHKHGVKKAVDNYVNYHKINLQTLGRRRLKASWYWVKT